MTTRGTIVEFEKSLGVKTVFVVDDDENMCRSLESLLRSLGYRVEAFTSAQGFLKRVETGVFGCLLLDVRLPVMSGLEIQRRLAEAHVAIPIIFLTGHGDIQMAVSARKAGAIEFLPKPFREQQLIDAVADAMARTEFDEELGRVRDAYLKNIILLSPKERDVLDDLASGLQIKEIAGKRALSASTIRVRRRNIRSKIDVENFAKFLLAHYKYRSEADDFR